MKPKKIIYCDGIRFCRDEKTGYYLNSRMRLRLHRYVWEKHNGEIPKGFHVHHKDHNKANNDISNLQLPSAEEHFRLHGEELTDERREEMRRNIITKAVPAARAWHKTEEGHLWHIKHMERTFEKMHAKVTKQCKQCGKLFAGIHHQLFCCNNCKQKWRRDNGIDDVERICPACGNKYMTDKNRPNETCSHSCSNHYRWMKRQCA